MTFEAFCAAVEGDRELCPSDWREGQYLFNYLYALRPDLADQIRASAADPFYQDSRIPAFWAVLHDIWKD